MQLEQFVRVTGTAAPIMRINIDTDQIAPSRELIRVHKDGYGQGLFSEWRYTDPINRVENPDFILNQEPYRHAVVLISDRNFGCGSSREAAAALIRGFGFRSVIAPSFGGIFYNNCFRNGIVPVILAQEQVHGLAKQVEESGGHAQLSVDLKSLTVTDPYGRAYAFTVPANGRQMLLEGVDEIDLTLKRSAEIAAFRRQDRTRRPWAWRSPAPADRSTTGNPQTRREDLKQ